jgi:hypothetical protein
MHMPIKFENTKCYESKDPTPEKKKTECCEMDRSVEELSYA